MLETIKANVNRLLLVLKLEKNSILAKCIAYFFFIVKNKSSLCTFVFIFSTIFRILETKFDVYWIWTCRKWSKLFTWTCYFSQVSRALKEAAHLWGLFFHHFFSFRSFYFTISSFLHYVVWLLKYKRKFFWKILVTLRWVMTGRMVNNFFLFGKISHSFINKQIMNFLCFFPFFTLFFNINVATILLINNWNACPC